MSRLELNVLRKYRETEILGNCYRHPELYSKLTEGKTEYPFIMDGYRKIYKENRNGSDK